MFLAYLLASTMAAPAATAGGQVSPADPAAIVLLLQREGYKARLDKDNEGDPMIHSAASGADFQIIFYDCTDHRDCGSLTFHAGYAMPKDKKPTAEQILDYNAKWRFGRAYLDDEQDPILELDLAFGGAAMPEKMFLDNLEVWSDSMGSFQRHIEW